MRAVIQRVSSAAVHVVTKENPSGELVAQIGPGLLTLLGVKTGDTDADVDWLMRKVAALRIFEDGAGKMNLSLNDVSGEHLIVSQFTLWADTSKGNRPSFIEAARPEVAQPLYDRALNVSRSLGLKTSGGRFQSTMRVSLVNDGPVTLILESPVSK